MSHLQYMPGDPRLVDQIVYELKSKGIFDKFRKECIADVDTRPAYQNLRQRVETSVSVFLGKQKWNSDLNKNQLREKLRKHLLDGNYLEQGVERIVDQVVNPKVTSVFIPQVEDLVYNYLGIPRKKNVPETSNDSADLLPTDLEAVSPGSVHSNEDKNDENKENGVTEEKMEVDEDSKPHKEENEEILIVDKVENDSETPAVIDLTSKDSEASLDVSSIPFPTQGIKLENIPRPEKEVEVAKIALPKDPYPSTDIPLPDKIHMPNADGSNDGFNSVLLAADSDDDSTSDSSIIRNMSPLTPVRNFDEDSSEAQQGFDNNVQDENKNGIPVSSFRFTIEKQTKDSCDDKKDTNILSYQFDQVNIKYDAEDSSNSNNLQIDYESDANSKAIETKLEPESNSEDVKEVKKEKEEKKSSHKSSQYSRDSHRSSSSKDKKSDSKHSKDTEEKGDKKTSETKDEHKSKPRKDDRKDKESSRDSSKHRHSSHKSSSKDRDSRSHRSSSSSHRHSSSKSDDKKPSSSSKDKSSSDKKDHKSRDSKDRDRSSHRSDKDKKKSSSSNNSKDDKKKEKKHTDDHYSASGRNSITRRSTDRDSNDGNSTSSKGSNNQSANKSSQSKAKSSSSKSENTSSCSDGTSPSDKDNKMNANQIKRVIHVDTHLETPIAESPVRPTPEVILKKPKIAENFEEARKIMKMRQFLNDEQKRLNQEAALLLEFHASVRPNMSQVYSSIPGPELEFACINTSSNVETVETNEMIEDFVNNTTNESEKLNVSDNTEVFDREAVVIGDTENYRDIEVTVEAEAMSESDENRSICDEVIDHTDQEQDELSYFTAEEIKDSKDCKDKFTRLYKDSTTEYNKFFLVNCSKYVEDIFQDIAKDYDIISFHRNGHIKLKTNKTAKNIQVKNTKVAIPEEENTQVFSPVKSECSFELSSDYDLKLEEMVNNTSRQQIMEIILGGAVVDESPTKMPTIDYCTESSIEQGNNALKRRYSEIEGDNNNRQILTPNKIRKLSSSDQITSTTEETLISNVGNENPPRSKFLGKARRVGLPKPKRINQSNSPSSDKSVENYENPDDPSTINGRMKPAAPRNKVQRYDTTDLYKPKLHYLSRRNNIT